MRTKLSDISASRIPDVLGACADDFPKLSSYINQATQQLIIAAGENGFWGGWHKVVFNVTRTDPYITLPPQYARMISMDVCRRPVPIQNEHYEFLEFGIGLQVPCENESPFLGYKCGTLQGFDRNVVNTAYDLTPTNQYLRIYITDARDIGAKFLISGALDANGVGIYTNDVNLQVDGFYLLGDQPFATSSSIVTSFQAFSKPVTYGDVLLYQVDATTLEEVLLSRYTPQETNPTYRRYFIKSLPCGCCQSPTNPGYAQVTTLLKVEYQPVINPSDFLIIGNIPALKAECQSIRFSEIDNATSEALSVKKHEDAVALLNAELKHYIGALKPAINVAPYGSAKLENQQIGILI
jgi:hypothetical protein